MADPVTLAITAAMMAAQMAITASQKIAGPRLDGLDITLADYGTPLPRFWGKRKFETPIIWAEKLREEKHTSKTKGGKYAEYKYFGSFAVAIADHEIDGVTRIWMDRHLVYQRTATGPVSGAVVIWTHLGITHGRLKLAEGHNMRTYLGTETQEPDPRIESWCEDRYGPDSCPAYRGVSYIVFEELPLEKFGNRIPQITVEAVYTKADIFPYESEDTERILYGARFTPDFNRLLVLEGAEMEVWDVPTRTRIVTTTNTVGMHYGVAIDGTVYGVAGSIGSQSLVRISPDGGEVVLTDIFEAFGGGADYVGEVICVFPYAGIFEQALYYDGEKVTYIEPGFIATHYFEDADGNAWACGEVVGTDHVGFCTMPGGEAHIVATAGNGAAYAMDNGAGQFFVWQDSDIFLVDKTTWTAGSPVSAGFATEKHIPFRNIRPGTESIWLDNTKYSTLDLSVIETVDFADWLVEDVADVVFDPVNHALLCRPQVIDHFTWRYLDRIANAGTELEDIVTDVAGWCGLTGVDAAELDQLVLGYSVTQGSGKDMIAPLLDIHDSDARPHDFGVQFLKRGNAASGTLLTPEFVRESDEARYVATIAQDTDITRKLTITYADDGKDEQANTVISQRPLDTVDSEREQTINLDTYNSTPGEMQKLADRYFRRQWFGRETIQLGLTAQNLALEPADVKTVSLDGEARIARCTKITLSAGSLRTEWVRDDPVINEFGTGAGADMGGRDPEIIFIPSPTKGFVLDIPLVEDADESVNPQLYYAAGSYGLGNWPGAVVWQGDPNGETFSDDWNTVDSASGATWGYATDVLGTANANLWDRGNSVNIKAYGTLTSTTEAAIDADPTLNMAYLGGELLNFTTAFLEGDGTYTLSGFKRGRRGTEWAVGGHAVQDEFVLVSALDNEGMGISEVGNTLHFKTQTLGRSPDSSPDILVAFAGNSLKPYAPAVQSITKDAVSGDITVDFDRRTRVGGSWNGSTIPLGETTEAYELDVLDGSDVARTLTATTSIFTYTAAQQTTDFGAPIAANDLDALVYQMSATVGRGFAATV